MTFDFIYNYKFIFLAFGIILFYIVIELIRKRLLMEKYSVIWILFSLLLINFVWIEPYLLRIMSIQFLYETFTLFLLIGFVASLIILLQMCITVTTHSMIIKNLVQEIALLKSMIKKNKDH